MSDDESNHRDDDYVPDLFSENELAEIASHAMLHADEVKDESPEEAILMLDFAKVALDARTEVRKRTTTPFEKGARNLGISPGMLKAFVSSFLEALPGPLFDQIETWCARQVESVPVEIREVLLHVRDRKDEEDEKHGGLKAVPFVPEPPIDGDGNQGGI